MDEVAKTIRLECVGCDHVWRDTPAERRRLAREARFIAANPLAPADRASFHWNALLPTWVPWRSIVEEFLNAVGAAKGDPPDIEPLKAFYNETLGLAWESALGVVDDFGFIDDRRAEYDFGEAWGEEVFRFMAADKQARGGEHYWWLIRAFGRGGKSRLIAYGRCHTFEELDEIRQAHAVRNTNAIIDSGFRATEVYRFCLRFGWKPFKGDQTAFYTVSAPDPKDGKERPVRRLWRKTMVDPSYGMRGKGRRRRQHLALYTFASESLKDYLAEFMQGLVGEWTLPREVGNDYKHQLTAERRVAVQDRKGRTHFEWHQFRPDNHLHDCEQMILVAAIITRLVHAGVVRAPAGKVDAVG
jgi:phage terminase large subunit GpA-like protein